MGGMIAQEYALAYGVGPALGHLRLHLRRAGPVLLPDVRHVGRPGAGARGAVRHARRDAVGVHRPVLRAARGGAGRVRDRDAVPGPAGARLPGPARGDPATTTPRRGSARSPRPPWCWPGRRTSSSRSRCPGGCTRASPDRSSPPRRAAMPACGSTRPRSTRPSSHSSSGTEGDKPWPLRTTPTGPRARHPGARPARPVRRHHAGPGPGGPGVQPVLHHRRHRRPRGRLRPADLPDQHGRDAGHGEQPGPVRGRLPERGLVHHLHHPGHRHQGRRRASA